MGFNSAFKGLNRRGCQFDRPLAGELCTSVWRVCTARASLCSAVMWRLLVTHAILLFPLYFSDPCVTVCHHISNAVYMVTNCSEQHGFRLNFSPARPTNTFYILLSVHIGITVVSTQLDTQFLLWYVYLNPLHVSSNCVLILRRTIVLIF